MLPDELMQFLPVAAFLHSGHKYVLSSHKRQVFGQMPFDHFWMDLEPFSDVEIQV